MAVDNIDNGVFRILRGQEVIDAQQIQVNRWGGTQRIGMIYK